MPNLVTYVYVHTGETSTAYGPGDTIPADVAKLITNPDVWEGGQAPSEAASGGVIPPKGGPGSNAAAWRTYATSHGFETDKDATRDEIIDALAAEGIATE